MVMEGDIVKNERLAIRASLNSFCIIIGAFGVLQAAGYTRDAVLLQTGSVSAFLVSFIGYIGTRVLPVTLFFLIFIFRQARLFELSVNKVRSNAGTYIQDRDRAIKRYTSFKRLIMGLNLLGFTIGYIVDLILLKKLPQIFEIDNLTQLTFNLCGGALYATAQIAINELIFSNARQVLRIESVSIFKRRSSVRNRLVVVTILIALYSMLFVFRNGSAMVQHEIVYSETMEEALAEGLDDDAIRQRYAEKTEALLAESSSRLQLKADAVVFPDAGSDARYKRSRNSSIIMFIFAFLIVSSIEFAVAIDIRKQLRLIAERIRNVSRGDGDLTARIPIMQGDEIGEISDEFNTFMDSLATLIGNVTGVATAVSQSSASIRDALTNASSAAEESVAATEAVQQSTQGQINIAEEAQGTFDSLFRSIRAISSSVDEQASSIDETSAAMEEMAASINSVNGAAKQASAVANGLSKVANDGGAAIGDAIESMQSIRDAAKQVTRIVEVITDLTEQTNLLAMNAAIEAAHAGQEGRGFAVVATEVKRLAEDEGGQASQIVSQIEEMNDRIQQGVRLSDSAGSALEKISNDIQRTVTRIEEISSAMQEQASGADEIVRAVSSVVDTTHSIRSQVLSQGDEGSKLRKFMANLVDVSNSISGASQEQVVGNREVLQAVQKVFDEAEKNGEIVSTLSREMSRFKFEDRGE